MGRLEGRFSNTSQRRSQKNSVLKEISNLTNPTQERSSRGKLWCLKYLILFSALGILLKVLHSPIKCRYAKSSSYFTRSTFASARWMWREEIPDPRYESNFNIQWDQILKVTKKLNELNETMKVGLVNFNSTEIKHWEKLFPTAKFFRVHLSNAGKNIIWDDLYPEWIDEEEEFDVPHCQNLPDLKMPRGAQIHLVAAKLPCNKTGNWTRDIARLHLQHAAAKLSANMMEGHDPAHVLLVTECLPIPNLFSCKQLVARKGNIWLYKPDLNVLTQKLQFPIGSCELSLPFKHKVPSYGRKECGAESKLKNCMPHLRDQKAQIVNKKAQIVNKNASQVHEASLITQDPGKSRVLRGCALPMVNFTARIYDLTITQRQLNGCPNAPL